MSECLPSSIYLSGFKFRFLHSRPQSPRSFWPAAGIESSGLVQHRKSAIHGLPVKYDKSDWLRIRNEYSAHAQKTGSGQSSRSLPQARRIVDSGDANETLSSLNKLEQLPNYQIVQSIFGKSQRYKRCQDCGIKPIQ